MGAPASLLAGAPRGHRGQVGDRRHVVVVLAGQPDHEVQLDAAEPGRERRRHGGVELLLGDALVDRVAQTLRTRPRGRA